LKDDGGFLVRESGFQGGDPSGYREVILDKQSLLDPISADASRFRVSDYDPEALLSSHRQGFHRYLISGSMLESDLFINMPKMKTHQKAGVTGALKNLVGMNGAKEYLVHHRRGRPAQGGDEFPEDARRLVVWQTRIRDVLQGRSPRLFRLAQSLWRGLKNLSGLKTEGTPENLAGAFYVGAGSWYGNDTVWRMIYDLNQIVRHAPPGGGVLSMTPQRDYLAILDATVAGEGNGPLQPLPVPLNRIGIARNPFVLDMAMTRLMGFDPRKVPQLKNRALFPYAEWGNVEAESVRLQFDGEALSGIQALPVLKSFLPPPGWKGHLEEEDKPRG
jgi:hypothetical protein